MPNASVAKTTLKESGGGAGLGTDLICVLSVMQSGTDLSSGGVIQPYASPDSVQATFGNGEGLDYAAHYSQLVGKTFLFGALKNVVAAAIANVDVTHVTGSSVITFTGTPLDDAEIRVGVSVGGTIGTVGISIWYSLDNGRTQSGNLRLGTATSYLIPGTGVTANFAAGTLVANDYATCVTSSPKWDATGLTAAFTAIKNLSVIPRAVIVLGDVSDSAHLANVTAAILDYETSVNRFSRVFCSARDNLAPAVAQMGAATVTVAGSGPYTYTRTTGSYVTDGFKAGMTVKLGGFVNTNNNGNKTITNVAATILTVTETSTAESATASTTAVATETDAQWQTAIEAIVGSTPSSLVVSHKTVISAGRARRVSPIDGFMRKRPASWPLSIRWMSKDVKTSPGRVQDQGLENWFITDINGNPEQHDERISPGCLAMRFACLKSYAEIGVNGVYAAFPGPTLDNDGAPMSLLPVGGVADIAANIVQSMTTKKLQSAVALNNDGTITNDEATFVEKTILAELKRNLLSPSLGGSDPGPRASSVTFKMDRTVDISVPGATVPTQTQINALGYLLNISNTIVVGTPSTAP